MDQLERVKVRVNELGSQLGRLHEEITTLQKFTIPAEPQLRAKRNELAKLMDDYARAKEEADRVACGAPQCPNCGSDRVRKQGSRIPPSYHCEQCRRSFNNNAEPVWHQPSDSPPVQPRRRMMKPAEVAGVAAGLPAVDRSTGREL